MMKRVSLGSVIILISLILGYQMINAWRGMALSETASSKEALLRARGVEPENPTALNKLGLLYQWNLHQWNLNESVRYFHEAILKNPLDQECE